MKNEGISTSIDKLGVVKTLSNFEHYDPEMSETFQDHCPCVETFFEVNGIIFLDLISGRNKHINAKFRAFFESCCRLGKDYERIKGGAWKRFDKFVQSYGLNEDIDIRTIINIQAIPEMRARRKELSTKRPLILPKKIVKKIK